MSFLDKVFKKDKKEEDKKQQDSDVKKTPKKEDKKKSKKKQKKKKTDSTTPLKGSVLKRPVVSEKSRRQSMEENKYSFVVENWANKSEVKKEVESRWGVTVKSVNTMKNKDKTRKIARRGGGSITGSKSSIKKAIVTLEEGDNIDIFSV